MRKTRGFQRQVKKLAAKRAVVTPETLLVGLDLGQKAHAVWVCRPDQIPLEQFMVEHSLEGLELLLARTHQIRQTSGLSKLLFSMEPTSHYWMVVADFLERNHHPYRLVQPISVWRERQAQDYSFAKADFRDARMVGQLTAQLKFTQTQLPDEAIWVELEQMATEVQDLTDIQASEQTRIRSLLELTFPDFLKVFAHPTRKTALAVLTWGADPDRIASTAPDAFLCGVRAHFSGQRLMQRRLLDLQAQAQASNRLGFSKADRAVAFRLQQAAARYHLYHCQLEPAKERLMDLYDQLPYAENLDSIPNLDALYHAQTLAFMGDPRDYDDARCLPKLAGQNARENESGQTTGKRTITLHGRSRLRRSANNAAYVLIKHNAEFKARYEALVTRPDNPLHPLQAIVACGNKYLRIAHTLCVHNQFYQPDRILQRTCA